MIILSIDTSADETSCAITEGRKVLSNVIFSQIMLHAKWGGIFPTVAKRAHEERIDQVVEECLKKAKLTMKQIDFIAVTQGPGLAIALEIGIKKAKELSLKYNKKIISVNHLEGHIYSSFVQNKKGNPPRHFTFPFLSLVLSGGHTEIVLLKDHVTYEVLGETLDDASGEALDKAAKMLGLGYPGGPVIERLAKEVNNKEFYPFPRPMLKSGNLLFSFSGLKTSLFYFLKKLKEKDKALLIRQIASSYQEAVFDTIIKKTESAIRSTKISNLAVGGGVIANMHLRFLFRKLIDKYKGSVIFPSQKYLTGDNAAMIGVVAYYKAKKNMFVTNIENFGRIPRFHLTKST